MPPERDPLLAGETAAILAAEPGWLVVSTASGLQAWLEAAGRHGSREEVTGLLRAARVAARGAKGVGALRALGISPEFVSPQETMDDVCSWLAGRTGPGDVLAVQLHGGEVVGTLDLLRRQAARVLQVAPYRWVLPADTAPAQDLVRQLAEGALAAVV